MSNCKGKTNPNPKDSTLNLCGDYIPNPDGPGYTSALVENNVLKSQDYCVPYGSPLPINFAALKISLEVIGALSLLIPGAGEAVTPSIAILEAQAAGAASLIPEIGIDATTGAAIGDTIDQLVADSKTKEYTGEIDKYCRSIGDSDSNYSNTSMWIGSDAALGCDPIADAKCAYEFFIYDPPSCITSDRNSWEEYPRLGCCQGYCARDGVRPGCVRNKDAKFPGKPVVCCFLDYKVNNDGDPNPDSCYEDPVTKQRTCSYLYRDLAAPSCQDEVEKYCLGNEYIPQVNNYLDLWIPDAEVDLTSFLEDDDTPISNPWHFEVSTSNAIAGYGMPGNITTIATRQMAVNQKNKVKAPCLNAIARSIYNGEGQIKTWEELVSKKILLEPADISVQGYAWSLNLIEQLYKKYTKEYGSFIGTINQDGYRKSDQFKEILGEICGHFPFLCTGILKEACQNVTADQFIYLPADAQSWCGCYMNEKEYEKYNNLSIKTECTPTCNSSNAIPLVDSNNIPKICKDTLCVIDDLNINITNSINPGGFNFNQLCRSCGGVDQVESTSKETAGDQITDKQAFAMIGNNYPTFPVNSQLQITINNNTIDLEKGTQFYGLLQDLTLYSPDGTTKLSNVVANFSVDQHNNATLNALGGADDAKNPVLETGEERSFVIWPSNKNFVKGSYPTVTVKKGFPDSSINISSFTNVGSTTSSINANTCTCILPDGTIDSENEKIGSFNLNQHCGVATCHSGTKTIPCTSGSIEYTAISSVEDSLVDFKTTMVDNKNNFFLTITSFIFLFFTIIFFRIFRDDVGKNTKYFTYIIVIVLIVFVILSVIKAVKEDDDLSENFQ